MKSILFVALTLASAAALAINDLGVDRDSAKPAQPMVVNGCSYEAFQAATAIAKMNGAKDVRVATRTMVAGIQTSAGLVFNYAFNPTVSKDTNRDVVYSVKVLKAGEVCTIMSVSLDN